MDNKTNKAIKLTIVTISATRLTKERFIVGTPSLYVIYIAFLNCNITYFLTE